VLLLLLLMMMMMMMIMRGDVACLLGAGS